MITRNDDNIQSLIDDNTHVIVQFGAPWCMPCKQLKPKVEKISYETPDIVFAYCDIESTQDFSKKMKVMSIPTVIGFHNGEIVVSLSGSTEAGVKCLVEKLRSKTSA